MADRAHRLSLGQWTTPPAVVDLALALAQVGPGARVLDPSCGDGAFLAGAIAAGASTVDGIEVDGAAAAAARRAVAAAHVTHADLFDVPATEGGYDAVVGNPPYVRQERLGNERKRRVRARLAADWPELAEKEIEQLVGRGDLAVACIARALRLVRPGGRIAFVVSSALVDAGYAASLWRLVCTYGRVRAIVAAPDEVWFPEAAINPVIVVIERVESHAPVTPTVVARLRVPTRAAAAPLDQLARVAHVRAGSDPAGWAALLRAPEAWFELCDELADRLVPLGDVADVRRGVTSGANDVFYLTRARARELGLEREVLVPLLKRPGDRVFVDPASTSWLALACAPDQLARAPRVRRYLEERAAAAARPSLRGRRPWWALPVRPARLFLAKAYDVRFVQHIASMPMVADQRLYGVHPRPGVAPAVLAAVLNSSFTSLALESLGRASMGQGALEWTVADAAALPVVDPRRVDAPAATRALAAYGAEPIAAFPDGWRSPCWAALDRAVAPDVARDGWCEQLAASIMARAHRGRCRAGRSR